MGHLISKNDDAITAADLWKSKTQENKDGALKPAVSFFMQKCTNGWL